MTTIELKLPRLYPKQYAALFAPERYSLIEASTKSGKTAGALCWLLATAWEQGKDGRNYWWVAPVYSVAKIAFRRMCRMLTRVDPDKQHWNVNESEMFIRLTANGAYIQFKGADKPDSLYGEDVYAAVVDEATRCKEEAWYAVRTTLTATKGPVRIIGNVKGRKNWAYKLGAQAKGGDATMSYHKLTAWDAVEAGVLDREEIEDAKSKLPEAVFKELYLAEPSDDGGNPFGIAAIAKCIKPLSSLPPVAFGVDLAKSHDWTWILGLDTNGNVCVDERWQGDWGGTRTRLIRIIGDVPAMVDSTGVGDPIVEDLQRALPNVEGFKFSQMSKQQIMEGLASAIQREETGYPAGLLVDELESFEYEYTRTGVRYTAPEGMTDDGVCALALAVRKRTIFGNTLQFSVVAPGANRLKAVLEEEGWR